MAITIRQELDAASQTTAITLTTAAGMLTTDTLLLVQANDYYTAANLLTPTGTAGTSWTLQHTADGGSNLAHAKVWTSNVAAAGAQTVIANATLNDDEHYAALFVLTGAASGIDGVASTPNAAASLSHVAPTVTPTSGRADDLLVCLFATGIAGTGAVNYTMPGSMIAYTEQDVGGVSTFRAGSEQLASASATGTRTATSSTSLAYLALSVLTKSTAAAAVPPRRPRVVAQSVSRSSNW